MSVTCLRPPRNIHICCHLCCLYFSIHFAVLCLWHTCFSLNSLKLFCQRAADSEFKWMFHRQLPGATVQWFLWLREAGQIYQCRAGEVNTFFTNSCTDKLVKLVTMTHCRTVRVCLRVNALYHRKIPCAGSCQQRCKHTDRQTEMVTRDFPSGARLPITDRCQASLDKPVS